MGFRLVFIVNIIQVVNEVKRALHKHYLTFTMKITIMLYNSASSPNIEANLILFKSLNNDKGNKMKKEIEKMTIDLK